MNENRPILSAQKCRLMTLVSGSFWWIYANIRGGSPVRGRQKNMELSTTEIFSIFAGYVSDILKMRPELLYGDMQSVVGFSVIPKCMILNDPDWLSR